MPVCYQINFQRNLGGGEVFTRSFSRALAALGWDCVLLTARGARYWTGLKPQVREMVEIDSEDELDERLPREHLVITHTALSENAARGLAATHRLCGFAHMPLYDREPRGLAHYRCVIGVSEHVLASARARGLTRLYPEPVYGTADVAPRGAALPVAARSPYDWDTRKIRDRLLRRMESFFPSAFGSGEPYRRSGTLTLAVVSRLTPIKQFPDMFAILAPILGRYPDVRLEIFGAGGYASVRDFRRALRPCAGQVRFWGAQPDVASVYPQVDYVLSGLPEKEALGLNLIEAQASGTPVLAVRKPPFIETVLDGETGYLFRDPREDEGADFERLLKKICEPDARLRPQRAAQFLERFSEGAFALRVERLLEALKAC